MNNYEKIKNMSIDEMAEFIQCGDCFYCKARDICGIWDKGETNTTELCDKYAKQWLESEENKYEV